jgi:hypothetical protein
MWFETVDSFKLDDLRSLLVAGANPNWKSKDARRETALHRYAKADFDWGIGVLVAHGANPCQVDADGSTPLARAASSCSESAVRRLILAGADPRQENAEGLDALGCARVVSGRGQAVVALLCELCGKKSALKAIKRCAGYGDLQTVQALARAAELPPSWLLAAGKQTVDGAWDKGVAAKWLMGQAYAQAEARVMGKISQKGREKTPQQTPVSSESKRL